MKKKRLYLAALIMLLAALFGMNTMAAGKTKVVTLKNNKTYTKEGGDFDDITYHKISVKSPGYLVVTGYKTYSNMDGKYGLAVQLCDSKKKPLENEYATYLYKGNSWKSYYGVKKGVYYLKVKGQSHALKYSFKVVKEVSGAKKTTASALKKNKIRYGLLPVGENGAKEDWYKVTLPKAQKLKFTISSRGSGYVAFEIIPKSNRVFLIGSYQSCRNQTKKIETKKAMPAGTYYIKVYRSGKTSNINGYYSITWK